MLAAGLLLPGCAVQRSHDAARARGELVGQDSGTILACMGVPTRRMTSGDVEVWTYRTGNEARTSFGSTQSRSLFSSGSATGFGLSQRSSSTRHCLVHVAMRQGAVSRVSYTGPSGGILDGDDQCAFAIRSCLR